MSTPPPVLGSIDRYALPWRLGGWLQPDGPGGPWTVVATAGGREVGRVAVAAAGDARLDFTLDLQEAIAPGLIASGTLVCVVEDAQGRTGPLPFWDVLAGVDATASALATLTTWQSRLGADFPTIVANLRASFAGAIEPIRDAPRPAAFAAGPPEEPRASWLSFPAGLTSRSGDAVLGGEGHVFLLRGSNDLMAQYGLNPGAPEVADDADAWLRLFRDRRRQALARGAAFLQLVVPEKNTLLADHLPAPLAVSGPTPRLARLEALVAGDPALAPHYLSGLTLLGAAARDAAVFRRVDTHLTPLGAFRLARAVLDRQGWGPVEEPVFDRTRCAHADLADRFFDVPVLDPCQESGAALPPDRELVEQHVPSLHTHLGRRQVWRRPGAPVRRTLVVFGNSFCNFADIGQSYLSHWLATWFSAFHFIWDPAADWSYVDAVRPDLVLCQTIERFLPEVPPR